jgi:hypothetical protein
MRDAINHALNIAFPQMSVDEVRAVASHMPSAASISRMQSVVDAAIAVQMQAIWAEERQTLYLWADSSPQLSYNFLMVAALVVPQSAILDAFKAARELAALQLPTDVFEAELGDVELGPKEISISKGRLHL